MIVGRMSVWHSHVPVVKCFKLENVQLQLGRKKIMERICLLEFMGCFVIDYRRIWLIWQRKIMSRYCWEVVMWESCGNAGKGLGIKRPYKIPQVELLSVAALSSKKCMWLISKECSAQHSVTNLHSFASCWPNGHSNAQFAVKNKILGRHWAGTKIQLSLVWWDCSNSFV